MSENIDAHHGQGGSYVFDPETNKRELVERTKSHEEVKKEEAIEVTPLESQNEVEQPA